MHNIHEIVVVRITSGARKHRVSRARIQQALQAQTEAITLPGRGRDPGIAFLGLDDRGVELEIVAVVLPGVLLVIHAMPTHYRRDRT